MHRLDRGTSGLILFSFDKLTTKTLSESFMQGKVNKIYHAWVRGWLAGSGEIEGDLQTERGLQTALTLYQGLAQIEAPWPFGGFASSRFSLLRLAPKTGRNHQLRRHLARIGHPILGDSSHGDSRRNRQWASELGRSRLELYATSLSFPHPQSGEPLHFSLPPDPEPLAYFGLKPL